MNDGLYLTDHAPCGARGVVARRRIGEDELLEQALAVVPKHLHLDNVAAAQLLKEEISETACSSSVAMQQQLELVDELEQVQLVAAAILVERRKGSRSRW